MLLASLFALAAVAVASPTSTTPTEYTKFRRAGVSGCTCLGQTALGSSEPLFYGSSENKVGWCFSAGSMRPEWVAQVTTALESGVATTYLNTPAAITQCANAGITDLSECATYLIDGYTNAILGTSHSSTQYIAECTRLNMMDPDAYTQTDCQCGWVCNAPWERCGDDGCMDPYTQECVSGVIQDSVQITRKRSVSCPAGFEVCRARKGMPSWECLNTQTDIEACGGCPGTPGATDCTALPGIAAVSCRAGNCVVEGCARGFVRDGEGCTKLAKRR